MLRLVIGSLLLLLYSTALPIVNLKSQSEAWGMDYCEWRNAPTAMCVPSHHWWNCTQVPIKQRCISIGFHIFSPTMDSFELRCRVHGEWSVPCPHQKYTESNPCRFEKEVIPEAADSELSCGVFGRQEGDRLCITWKEAYYDICGERLVPHGAIRKKRTLIDFDHPLIQQYIQDNPNHFQHYTPHNRHASTYAHPHLHHRIMKEQGTLKDRSTQIHVEPLQSHVKKSFDTLANNLGEEAQESSSSPQPTPRPIVRSTNFLSLTTTKEPEEIIQGNRITHIHTFDPTQPPKHFVPDRPDPDLIHIQTYNSEHMVPVMKLNTETQTYSPDYVTLSHINANHPHNRDYHPSEFPDLYARDRWLEEENLERRATLFQQRQGRL